MALYLMLEHTVEPDMKSSLAALPWGDAEDGEFIGMKRGRCINCGASIDFDDDNAWHVED